jgi:glycosyltransferase involved in cell wall biosynthesis
VDLVIAPSLQIKEVLLKYKVTTPIEVLPTGIDLKPFAQAKTFDVYERFGLSPQKQILLYAGRLAKEKNIDFILKSVHLLQQQRQDFILFIAGGGDYQKNLQKKVLELGLQNHVFFSGYLPRQDLISVYHAAKLLLFPSHTETQGLVAVEAFACNTPVLALDSMGLKDVLKDDLGGYLLQDDIQVYAEHINMLLDNNALYQQKIQEAQKRAADFSSLNITKKLVGFYEDVMRKHQKKSLSVA